MKKSLPVLYKKDVTALKKQKIYSSLILISALFLICISSVFASPYDDVVISLGINNPIMTVNGVNTNIDDSSDTVPVIIGERTFVPVRAIIEAFGGNAEWDAPSRTVTLSMNDDIINLTVGSNIGYLNKTPYVLDTVPVIINERTMLPIRFIAEGFNLGVGWNDMSKTVFIVRNRFDESDRNMLASVIPEYTGNAYAVINNNVPYFKDYEIIDASFEYYSELDPLGRCNVCMASVGYDLMPVSERESINSVTPTGWLNKSYSEIDGGYLYNRCHLIGYQLTGENANERNLITGTRYLNIEGMLPFENAVNDYVENTSNNVMYRSTPVFSDNNLVADGVLLEAFSVEDNGNGISFCVYCYNVQPNITIDYATGESFAAPDSETSEPASSKFYRTPKGTRYHIDPNCGGKNSYEITYGEAMAAGLSPCKKCTGKQKTQ